MGLFGVEAVFEKLYSPWDQWLFYSQPTDEARPQSLPIFICIGIADQMAHFELLFLCWHSRRELVSHCISLKARAHVQARQMIKIEQQAAKV